MTARGILLGKLKDGDFRPETLKEEHDMADERSRDAFWKKLTWQAVMQGEAMLATDFGRTASKIFVRWGVGANGVTSCVAERGTGGAWV